MPVIRFLALLAGLVLAAPTLGHDASLKTRRATAKAAIDARPLDRPARDGLFACTFSHMTPAALKPWIAPDGTLRFVDKPVVAGDSVFREAEIAVMSGRDGLRVRGNGLPMHEAGTFPITRGIAAAWDRNPNRILAHKLAFDLPAEPQVAPAPSCLPMGPIGVALSGAVFFSALDAEGRDAVAHEITDACEGHPQENGWYHYHHGSPCFDDGGPGVHSPLIGFALDGFAIYGPRDAGGVAIGNEALDECHGHLGPVPTPDGNTRVVYHYHANDEFPYTLGCFRGTPGDGRVLPPAVGIGLPPTPPPAAGGAPSPGGEAGPPPGRPRRALGPGGQGHPPPGIPPPQPPS